jgi:hypothetical protein
VEQTSKLGTWFVALFVFGNGCVGHVTLDAPFTEIELF